jgi:hypothetical protein
MVTPEEFRRANRRGRLVRAKGPTAVAVRYDRAEGRIVVELSNGTAFAFPPAEAQGLEHARPADLDAIEITPEGLGLHFPALDADLYVPALAAGITGSERWMAARLGSRGGSSRSAAKVAASRENGRRGGRPRKSRSVAPEPV